MSRYVFCFVLAVTTTACDPSLWASWQDLAEGLQEAAEFCDANPGHDECPQVEGPEAGAGQVCVDGACLVDQNLGGAGFRCLAEDGCPFEGIVRVSWIATDPETGDERRVEGAFVHIDPTEQVSDDMQVQLDPDGAPVCSGILNASADGIWFRPEDPAWWQTTPEERSAWCAQFLLAWFPESQEGRPEWYSTQGWLTGNGDGWDCQAGRDGPLAAD